MPLCWAINIPDGSFFRWWLVDTHGHRRHHHQDTGRLERHDGNVKQREETDFAQRSAKMLRVKLFFFPVHGPHPWVFWPFGFWK